MIEIQQQLRMNLREKACLEHFMQMIPFPYLLRIREDFANERCRTFAQRLNIGEDVVRTKSALKKRSFSLKRNSTHNLHILHKDVDASIISTKMLQHICDRSHALFVAGA